MPEEKSSNGGRGIGFVLLLMCLSIVTAIGTTLIMSAHHDEPTENVEQYVDSAYVVSQISEVVNPSFMTVEEVKNFQNSLKEEYSIDSTFTAMPEYVITNVATVCLRKLSCVTKQDIVYEYRANRSVYDNLGSDNTLQSPEQQKDETAVEEQHRPASKVSYRYELDTVEGQPQRVLVKEERTYEK